MNQIVTPDPVRPSPDDLRVWTEHDSQVARAFANDSQPEIDALITQLEAAYPTSHAVKYYRCLFTFHYGAQDFARSLVAQSKEKLGASFPPHFALLEWKIRNNQIGELFHVEDPTGWIREVRLNELAGSSSPNRNYESKHEIRSQAPLWLTLNEALLDDVDEYCSTQPIPAWAPAEHAGAQQSAMTGGIPPVLVVTLPKSGSLFLQTTLSRGLDLPHIYLSPVGFAVHRMVPALLDRFSAGGFICVDHIAATSRNIEALEIANVTRFVVHFRDPRQSALSFLHHAYSDEVAAYRGRNAPSAKRAISGPLDFEQYEHYQSLLWSSVEWMEMWADFLETNDSFDVKVTNFSQLVHEKPFFDDLLDFFHIPPEKFDDQILDVSAQSRAVHFRKGLTEEWKEVLPQVHAQTLENDSRIQEILERFSKLSDYTDSQTA